jgi:hypothetical protein
MAGQITTDWKKDMDALYARTAKNWFATSKRKTKKAAGLTCQLSLGVADPLKKK